jgi:hypothetical protein
VGRLAGLSLDDSWPMALLPAEPLGAEAATALLHRVRTLLPSPSPSPSSGAEAERSSSSSSSAAAAAAAVFAEGRARPFGRAELGAVQDGRTPYWLSALPAGRRYLLLLTSAGWLATPGGAGGGAYLLDEEGGVFAILGETGSELASQFGGGGAINSGAGAGPALFDGVLTEVLAPKLLGGGGGGGGGGFSALFVSRSCACIGSPCLRHRVHGASIGAVRRARAQR